MSKRTSQFQIEALKKQFPFLFEWPEPTWNAIGKMDHPTVSTCQGYVRFLDVCPKCNVTLTKRMEVRAKRTQPLVRDDHVYSLTIARVTKELLDVEPCYQGATGSLVDISDDDAIFLLDHQGKLIGEVRQAQDIHHNEAHTDHVNEHGETVGEAICRLKAEKICSMILRRHTGFIIRDHSSVGGYDATLYLVPKGWSIAEWCQEKLRQADLTLAAQVAEISNAS